VGGCTTNIQLRMCNTTQPVERGLNKEVKGEQERGEAKKMGEGQGEGDRKTGRGGREGQMGGPKGRGSRVLQHPSSWVAMIRLQTSHGPI
jgi:hypothetical protein